MKTKRNNDMSFIQLKLAARKLFSKVFNIPYLANTTTIKRKFPKFDGRKIIHWYNLIDRCEQQLIADEHAAELASLSPSEQIGLVVGALRSKGFRVCKEDTFMGRSVSFSKNGCLQGKVGYCVVHNMFYFAFGRNGRNNFVNDIDQVINGFLSITQYNVA